jgi:enoyl-CoA hydratase/carnithine racemase
LSFTSHGYHRAQFGGNSFGATGVGRARARPRQREGVAALPLPRRFRYPGTVPDDAPSATVRLERDGAIATITLDRPDKRNALSPTEHRALQAICDELREDFETRVVILTGAGRAFSAGADLSNPRESGKPRNDLERRSRARIGDRTVAAIDSLDQITIAAVNGACVGGGAVLALACDIRVMERSAWMSVPEVEIGMPLTWGALPLLVREIGPARTIELVTTCDRVSADEALAHRLVSHVVDDGASVAKARAIAAKIVRQPAVPVAMTKTTVRALRSTAGRGDVTAADGDLYWLAIKLGGLRVTGPPKRSRPSDPD